jgi:hypothetical protein
MGKRNVRAIIVTLSCLIGVTCLLGRSLARQAPSQSEVLGRDFPVLSSRFGEKPQKVDYVIVLDRSGSMNQYWDEVRDGLKEFVNVATQGDDISIVTFADVAAEAPEAADVMCNHKLSARSRTIDSPSVREALQKEIEMLCRPAGSSTDLGQGVEETLRELDRANGNDLKIIFFFSDFVHTPPERSAYYGKHSPRDGPWVELARRRKTGLSNKKILAYAMLLRTDEKTGRDLGLVRSVFDDLLVVPINSSTIRGELLRIRAEVLRDKLRAQVQVEAALPKLSAGKVFTRGTELVAVLEAEKPKGDELLAVDSVSNVRVANFQAGALADHLTPAAPSDKTYRLDPNTRQVEVPVATIDAEGIVQQEKSAPVSFDLTVTRTLKPADEINRLLQPADRVAKSGLTAAADVTLQFKPGGPIIIPLGRYAPWLLGLSAAAVLLFVGRAVYRRRAEYIDGTFTIRASQNGSVVKRRFNKRDRRTRFSVGRLKEGLGDKLDCPLPDADWLLQFEAQKSTSVPRKQRGLYLMVREGRVRLLMSGTKLDLKRNDPDRLLKSYAKVEAGCYTITFNRNSK